MFEVINEYLDEWEKRCGGGRIYVLTNLFGKRRRIYIDECLDHWFPEKLPVESLEEDAKESQRVYSDDDIAYRLSLLPCVREVLTVLPHDPVKSEKEEQRWEVEARLPRPRDPQSNQIEVLKIVIAYDSSKGWHLKTYHPYWDTVGKKKKKKKPMRS